MSDVRCPPAAGDALAALALSCVLLGCGATPPSATADSAPAPALAAAPEPVAESGAPAAPAQPVHECGQDNDEELPIVVGHIGEGERVVRLINNSGAEVQARLLDSKLAPALPGTLRVPAGSVGEFKVAAGVYQVRYRNGKSCAVRRGAPLHLTGARAGVEISIKPKFETGNKSKMRQVKEPL